MVISGRYSQTETERQRDTDRHRERERVCVRENRLMNDTAYVALVELIGKRSVSD